MKQNAGRDKRNNSDQKKTKQRDLWEFKYTSLPQYSDPMEHFELMLKNRFCEMIDCQKYWALLPVGGNAQRCLHHRPATRSEYDLNL